MKNSKKVLSILLMVCGLLFSQETSPIAIPGGDARGAALGGNPGNPYIMDFNNIYTNPAYAMKYSDLLYVEVGNTFTQYGAKNQSIGWTMGYDGMAFGISIGRREGPVFAENVLGTGTFASSDYMTLPGYEPMAPIQLYGAMKMGGMMLGVSIYRSAFSQLNDGTGISPFGAVIGPKEKNDFSVGQTGLKVGVLMGENSTMVIDGSLLVRINSLTNDYTDGNTNANPSAQKADVTGMELGIQGRMFYKMSEKLTIVPMARFYSFGYEPELTNTPPPSPANTKPNNYGRMDIEIGAGANTKIGSSIVSVGLSFESITLTNDETDTVNAALVVTKNSRSITSLPKINIGAEIPLNSWLTGRVGYFRKYTTTTTTVEPPAPAVKTEFSQSGQNSFIPNLGFAAAQQELSFGIGMTFEGLSFNGYLADQFLADGPNFISGKARDLFGVLSMSYQF